MVIQGVVDGTFNFGTQIFAKSGFCQDRSSVDGDALGLLAGGAPRECDCQDSVFHHSFDILGLNNTRKFIVRAS